MDQVKSLIIAFSLITAVLLIGCSSSEKASEKKEPARSAETQPPAEKKSEIEAKATAKVDTLNVDVQSAPKPSYEAKTQPQVDTLGTNVQKPPSSPGELKVSLEKIAPGSGKYCVQLGAYKMADNADRVATLAKDRLHKKVATIPDKVENLFKVMVGEFATRDEARKFRDEIARMFPDDYKDAWVSEIPQQ